MNTSPLSLPSSEKFNVLICDECHKACNVTTKFHMKLKDSKIPKRFGLTGTPVQNALE
eukprot:Awhi_evm1s9381